MRQRRPLLFSGAGERRVMPLMIAIHGLFIEESRYKVVGRKGGERKEQAESQVRRRGTHTLIKLENISTFLRRGPTNSGRFLVSFLRDL